MITTIETDNEEFISAAQDCITKQTTLGFFGANYSVLGVEINAEFEPHITTKAKVQLIKAIE